MRILHVIPNYAPAWKFGGPVKSVSALCEGLAALGNQITVATTNAGLETARGSDFRREVVNGVNVLYFDYQHGIRGIASTAMDREMPSLVAASDVVHVTAVWQPIGPRACRSARRANVPYIISPRGSMGRYSLRRSSLKKLVYYALWERANFAGASGFHFTSNLEREETQFLVGSRPVLVSPNIISVADWFEDEVAGRKFRSSLGVPDNVPIILSVGRQHHKKGLEIIPPVLKNVRTVPWVMIFLGFVEDDTNDKLRALCDKFQLSSRVHFLDGLAPSEVRAAYSASDVVVLPSRHENFGNIVVEAVACGARVLASPKVGAAEFVAEPWVKIVPRTVEAWTPLLQSILAERAGRPGLCAKLDAFSSIRVANDMVTFYSAVLDEENQQMRRRYIELEQQD